MGKLLLKLLPALFLAMMMYVPSLSNHFIWDDHGIIRQNPALRMKTPLPLFEQTFWPPLSTAAPAPYYRPMTVFWFWLEYKIFGIRPLLFRIFNVFMFCMTIALLFFIIRKVFHDDGVALISAYVFALNPLHTESVCLISGLTDISAGIFLLIAMIFFSSERSFSKNILAPLSFLFALFSKEVALAGILIFPLYQFLIRRKKISISLTSTLPFIIPAVIYLYLRYHVLGVLGGYQSTALSFWQRIIAVPYILLRYIQNFVFPFDLRPLHPEWYNDFSMAFWLFWLIPLIAIIFSAAKYFKDRRLWLWLAWAVLFIIPSLRIGFQHHGQLWAERFFYISSFGASALLGYALSKIMKLQKFAFKAGKVAVIAYFCVMFCFGFEYAFWWRNDFVGFMRLIKGAPENPEGYSGLAEQFSKLGEMDSAVVYIHLALEKDSLYAPALGTAADIALKMQKYDEALRYSHRLIAANPNQLAGYIDGAWAIYALGNVDSALKLNRKAVEVSPVSPFANLSMGEMLVQIGDTDGGMVFLERAAILVPDDTAISGRFMELLNKQTERETTNVGN